MDDGHVEALIMRHGSGLMPWQKTMMRELLSGVQSSTLRGRGRRAGWTTFLGRVESALKDRDILYSWDESIITDVPRDF